MIWLNTEEHSETKTFSYFPKLFDQRSIISHNYREGFKLFPIRLEWVEVAMFLARKVCLDLASPQRLRQLSLEKIA